MTPLPIRRARAATLLSAALTGALLLSATPAAAKPAPATSLDAVFTATAKSYGVPRDLLVAVGYGETRLIDHDGLPSQDNGYGIMHLASNPRNHSLELAAQLTGLDQATLKSDARANVKGAAAVLRSYADKAGLTAADRARTAAWFSAVAEYAGASSDSTAKLYADYVYQVVQQGVTVRTVGGIVTTAPDKVRPELGRFAKIQMAGEQSTAAKPLSAPQGVAALAAPVPQYPGAHWVPANGGNYAAGRSAAITTVVIHVMQGSYAGAISWFQNPSAGVSAHYLVRSSDGDITQMVREEDTAYHARSANSYGIGIEHEGFIDNPSWFTDAMYRSSANLTRYLCDKWGIPKSRTNIKGHSEMPGNDHTDPGPNWNWNYYMSLVTAGGSGVTPGGSPTDFNGDGKDDIVTFNLANLNDAYVATSTGSAFAGTSVKWNDFFGLTGEKLLTGDFNGDNKDDIITFTGGTLGDVYVGLSTGTGFLGGAKWHDWFAPGAEVPAVGDVDGDGKDDIITFTHDSLGDVYVALSTGTGFGAGVKWHEFFAPAAEFPAVGDFNGDGKDDIVTFTQGAATAADVYVALSNGTSFGAGVKWHDLFAVGAEKPRVGDFNGDGKDDIVTFTCNADADVYAALSNGAGFVGTTVKWNDFFCIAGEFPYTGDYNGDGKDDIIVFSKAATNDVFVGLSTGTGFLGGTKWHDFFGLNGEVTL
ncbi:N-acetylmuramoyl-L-alanine amidase [Catellatospora tritici]|uniref:N-acetylmuramoyl-L-alanine amidase n=1 Tax=Catellatospora tritici TaxID=2851566 RepID=UPI001C2D9B8F|nr:N-acetylmuramoyl-L-alanine amidase [Catellatospora tritici]MBV1854858.1 N-acetylmuramoyl-L-alanine amidase [Catellatospora tritici]